jgi:erythromycin esterase
VKRTVKELIFMMYPIRYLFVTLLIFTVQNVGAQNLTELLERHAQTFDTPDELTSMVGHIGRERLVLMGEASHGTSEYYTKRAALSRKLIEEHGFNFIAVEADWSSTSRINMYVKHKPDAPENIDEAMESFTRWPLWMWKNEEVKELVQWMRDYNSDRSAEERVGFYGIDVYDNYNVMEDVLEWISDIDSDLGRSASNAYSCMTRFSEAGDYIRMVSQTGQNCSEDLVEVLEIVRSLEGRTNDWEFFRAEHGAKVAINAEQHYRGNLQRDATSWNKRASHFYLTAERLLEYYSANSRGIVWAHNTHIGDARATEMGRQGAHNIGQLAREALGRENVFAIGFGTYTGNVLAAYNWEGAMENMNVPESPSDSWEGMLEAAGIEKFYLIFDEPDLTNALDRWIPHRAIGVTYNPQNERGNYVQTVLPERYDAFVFIRNTGVLSPL